MLGEAMSDVILRLAKEAKTPAKPFPLQLDGSTVAPPAPTLAFAQPL